MNELRLDNLTLCDRYKVKGRISTGSYAEVFVASDLLDGHHDVVIKALNTDLQGSVEPDIAAFHHENFQKEISILRTLEHPNIVKMLGQGEATADTDTKIPFLVLEYMPGGDLLRFTRSQSIGRLDLGSFLDYLRQISAALTFAHSRGIIHRDLKPNNFLLSLDCSTVKIADFGAAKVNTEEPSAITRIGTGLYSAPEHSPVTHGISYGNLTDSADIYSLAKSCFYFLCGRSPSEFVGQPIIELPAAFNSLPWAAAFLDILRRATQNDVAARFNSVAEFWGELASLAKYDPEATRTTRKPPSPEELELQTKRAELAQLEVILAQKELEFLTLQAELKEFETLYLRIVGAKYAELDELEARIAEVEAKQVPENEDAQQRAEQARARANESAGAAQQVELKAAGQKFKPSDSVKKLFRELARLIHPDLVLGTEDKAHRHEVMAKANKAYEDGDENLLAKILDDWQNSPDAVEGEDTAANLVRVIRKIAIAKSRLSEVSAEIDELESSELFELRQRALEAEGRDLLAEMAEEINAKIAAISNRTARPISSIARGPEKVVWTIREVSVSGHGRISPYGLFGRWIRIANDDYRIEILDFDLNRKAVLGNQDFGGGVHRILGARRPANCSLPVYVVTMWKLLVGGR